MSRCSLDPNDPIHHVLLRLEGDRMDRSAIQDRNNRNRLANVPNDEVKVVSLVFWIYICDELLIHLVFKLSKIYHGPLITKNVGIP